MTRYSRRLPEMPRFRDAPINAINIPTPKPLTPTRDVSMPILQREVSHFPYLSNVFKRFNNSESLNICDRFPHSKVSNTCERRRGPELPDDRGRCPNLLGARKRYPGHEDRRSRPHLEAKVGATWSQCIRASTQTICEARPEIMAGGYGDNWNYWLLLLF